MFKYAIMQYTPQRYMRNVDFETALSISVNRGAADSELARLNTN